MKQIRTGSDTIISRDINIERYLRDIRESKPLSRAQERILIKAAQEGDQEAQNKLVFANLKFVVNCAKEYQTPGVEIIDLISAGNIGLIDAVKKFDLKSEVKFISYAVWWIKNAVIEHLRDYCKPIRLPYNQQNDVTKYLREKDRLEQKFETNLNMEQVAELSPEDKLIDNIQAALSVSSSPTSFSEPINDDENGTVEDLIADPTKEFVDKYHVEYRKKIITFVINKLPTIQQRVITLSFGLDDDIMRSNEDIAEQLGLTAERIRQVRNQALLTLKSNKELKSCL